MGKTVRTDPAAAVFAIATFIPTLAAKRAAPENSAATNDEARMEESTLENATGALQVALEGVTGLKFFTRSRALTSGRATSATRTAKLGVSLFIKAITSFTTCGGITALPSGR